jgi:hypothetical protein
MWLSGLPAAVCPGAVLAALWRVPCTALTVYAGGHYLATLGPTYPLRYACAVGALSVLLPLLALAAGRARGALWPPAPAPAPAAPPAAGPPLARPSRQWPS